MAHQFTDPGTYNLKDLDTNEFVAKIHVENSIADLGGGRSYVTHYAIAKPNIGDANWGGYTKPTLTNNKQLKWEGTQETLAQFLSWVNDATRKPNLRYVKVGVREQDSIP